MHRLTLIAFFAILSFAPLRASTITYTLTGEMVGYFTSTACPTCFSIVFEHDFTFDFNADTSGVFDLSPGVLANPVLSSSFTIGPNTGSFDEPLDVLVKGDIAGFENTSLTDGMSVRNGGFGGYGLTTDIGPLNNTGGLLLPSTDVFQVSADDTLHVTDYFDLEFSASVAPVPEPAYAGLTALAAGVAALLVRRRLLRPKAV